MWKGCFTNTSFWLCFIHDFINSQKRTFRVQINSSAQELHLPMATLVFPSTFSSPTKKGSSFYWDHKETLKNISHGIWVMNICSACPVHWEASVLSEVNSPDTMSAVLSARCEFLDKIHINNSLENLKVMLTKQV